MTQRITRRAILTAGLPTTLVAAVSPTSKKSRPLPTVGEFLRFVDPTTESTVVRLTNPTSASYLPAPGNRLISVRERFLIFSSDRTGRLTPFVVDLRTGVLHALSATANLLPRSLCLDTQGRLVYFIDGTDLKQVSLLSNRSETIADGASAFSIGATPSELVLVRAGRLEQLNAKTGPLAENVTPWCAVRPSGAGCAFGRIVASRPGEQEFWYVPLPASSVGPPKLVTPPKLLAQGRISNPLWSPDGRSLLFLREVPANNTFLAEIHEVVPETGLEQRIAPTSQFAAFAPNGDGSVFVGASASKAQPTIILLLRSVQREFTLCEHRASHPAAVNPVFSPDSRRVYFESDHEGKAALYSVNVELLVEPTTLSSL